MSIVELERTLPPDWYVKVTIEGRYIFVNYANDTATFSSWEHPDPTFPRNLYEGYGESDPTSAHVNEALSYTWGSPGNDEPAYVVASNADNLLTTSDADTLMLGHNLVGALRQLRFNDLTRTLWVDAICVNQRDENEKSGQLMKMRQILRLARRVMMWLGPSSETSRAALRTLETIGSL